MPKAKHMRIIPKATARINSPLSYSSAIAVVMVRVKPFAFPELLARCQTLVRRGKQPTPLPLELHYGPLSLDLLKHTLQRDQQTITINQREFMLMKLLLENSESVMSKTAILEHVWGHQFDPQTNVVDVLVCRLRSKVDKGFSKPLIHTLRGVGYVLKS